MAGSYRLRFTEFVGLACLLGCWPRKACLKRCVFNSFLKVVQLLIWCSSLGSLFQSSGPSTLNDRAAKVFLLVFGTSSLVVSFSDLSPFLNCVVCLINLSR